MDSQPDAPPIVWEGQWLRYGRSPDVAPQCAGVAPYMDRYVGALVDIFAISREVKVDFYYVDDESTPCDSLGCVRGHSAFSLVAVQEHELVHAVRSFEGFSHHLLEEGAAELWGDDSRAYPFRLETGGDLVGAAESVTPFDEGLPSQHYGLAGRFHALLMEDETPEIATMLLQSTSRTSTTEELDDALFSSTGQSLSGWGQALANYPTCTQGRYRNPAAACEAAQMVDRCEAGEVADIVEWVGCEDEDTLGPRDGEVWKYVTFEVTRPGAYSLFIAHDTQMNGGSVRLEQCEGGCESLVEDYPVPTAITPSRPFDAVAGDYLLRLSLPQGSSGEFALRIGGPCD